MSLRIPSPKALTKPEAYLAYKAGIMSRDELKQNLYNPLNNYEGWLAKWCGLLETYPTNKDGTPQCLTDEEGLLAYLCGVTDRYPASNSRPDDARISAYIRYLVSARYTRPDHPLNREEFYLSLIKTQFIPSGDPSSDIVIDGTAKAPFVDVKMYGDTYQQTYTGKNLLGASLAEMQSENTNGTWSNGTYTQYGITVTPVFSDGLLQRIELSGTATSNFVFTVSKRYSKTEFEAIATAGETYTLSGCPSGGSKTTYYARILETPYKQLYTDVGEGITKQMPSISSGATAVRLVIGVDMGTNATGLVFRLQFEKSATATTYEPFVGGQPIPSPDYPQAIQTVTGRQIVKITDGNGAEQSYTIDLGETIELDMSQATRLNAYINGSGVIVSSDANALFSIAVEPNTTYTITKIASSRFRYVCTSTTPAIGANVGTTTNNDSATSVTVTTGASDTYLVCAYWSSNSASAEDDVFNSVKITTSKSIELCKLGSQQDYIYKDGDDWKVHKVIGSNTFDGTERWSQSGDATTTVYTALTNLISAGLSYAFVGHSLSKMDSFHFINDIATPEIGAFKIVTNTSGVAEHLRLMFNKTAISTVDSAKEWIAANRPKLYATLYTPTDTTITDTALIAQLEALVNGGSEEGTTYIKVSATDPNLPAKLYVEAPKYD